MVTSVTASPGTVPATNGPTSDSGPSVAARLASPGDPVATAVRIPLRLSVVDGTVRRLYLPVTLQGQREHVIIDSGTARTWLANPSASRDWTDNAFEAS